MSDGANNVVPHGWIEAPLKDFADIQLGKMLSQKSKTGRGSRGYLRNVNVRWSRIDVDDVLKMDFNEREAAKFSLQEGDVLVCEGGEPGRAAVWKEQLRGVLYQKALHRVRTTREILVSQYLVFHLWSDAYLGRLTARFTGSTIKHFTQEALSRYLVRLAPIGEQRRIVAEIEKHFTRLDAAVAALERVKANLKRYRAAVLKAACEGRLVPTEAELARREGRSYETADQLLARVLTDRRENWLSRGKYQEPYRADPAKMTSVPEGWTWTTLGALIREPLRNGHSAKATGTGTGLRVFTLTAVTEGEFSERNTKRSTASLEKVADLWAEPGDIYVERSNTPELVGIARLYTGPARFAFIPDLFIRVRLTAHVLARYVETCLLNVPTRAFLRSRAQGIAGTMPKIDQETVQRAPIPLPPLAEQHRIVAEVERRLSVVDELDALVAANLKRAERLRQAILKRAFEGKLVPQDPNDEPASVLLERIRAERAQKDGAGPRELDAQKRARKTSRTRRGSVLARRDRGGRSPGSSTFNST